MLDFDLSFLYEVETKALNQAVKRNLQRFPKDFMFRLSLSEWQAMRSQNVTASESISRELKTVITGQKKRNTLVTPYAFTEQGVAMLSGVLSSAKAINMNIAIMRAFVEIRRFAVQQSNVKEQLKEIQMRLGKNDEQLSQIYDAMENMLDEKTAQKKWDDREKIGFKKT